MRMLRDCFNGQQEFDDPIYVGTFDKNTDERIEVILMRLDSVRPVDYITTKCLSVPTGLCVEVGYYSKVITILPSLYNNNAGYYITWERCCRNKVIVNINNPEAAGMTFYMEIPPPKLIKNSSPKWTNNPRTLLCNGNPFSYNLNFIDPDGDLLVYSLVTPLKGNQDQTNPKNNQPPPANPLSAPYPEVLWSAGHGNLNQIPGNPPLSIDPSTGQLSITPNVLNSLPAVFVSAIRVEEFRFGKKLGEVRLELQYTVSECSTNAFPQINYLDGTTKKLNGAVFNITVPDNLCFDILSTDNQDSIFVNVSGSILDSNIIDKPVVLKIDSGNLKTTTRFCWQTTCALTNLPPQKFTVEVRDNGCPLPKISKATFTVNIIPMPLINPTDILCMILMDNKETIIRWGDSTGNKSNFYKYNLYRSKDNVNYPILDSIFNKALRTYDDKNTPDYSLINYSYFMRGVNKCGFEGPPSDTLGTFDQLKAIPDQQKLITVTVKDNKRIKVLWAPTLEKDFAQYFLYRAKRNESSYQLIKNFINKYDTVYYDNDVDVNTTSYCYHLVMKDTCDNIGPAGKPSCSIVLKGISDPFEHHLSWLPYTYWDNGTRDYTLFRMDTENPYSIRTVASPSELKYTDDKLNYESGRYNYLIEANEVSGSDQSPSYKAMSRSNEIELIQAPLLHVPNAYTGNNDGINDDFGIHHVFVKDYHLKIFNRWGQLVFETSDKHEQWNGQGLDGKIQQEDVYVYLVSYTGWDDSSHVKKGNVTLLR